MNVVESKHISLGGRRVKFRLLRSRAARQLRVRVGVNGMDVVQPQGRKDKEVGTFLQANERWILTQLERTANLRAIRRPDRNSDVTILFRGVPTVISVSPARRRRGQNTIKLTGDLLQIHRGEGSRTDPIRSLEDWLRQQAKQSILAHLRVVLPRLKRSPGKVYVMSQRTKWGNCSSRGNLSFNWRLVMAPEFVLRYLVTHEAAHLAVPDHSRRFWLTVKSLCPETEKARQWLTVNAGKLFVNLADALAML